MSIDNDELIKGGPSREGLTRAYRSRGLRDAYPGDQRSVTEIEGLPVLRLSRLIESKLACGAGSAGRTHIDFADVVELIARNRLSSSFARYLHKSLRATYRELVRRARGDE